mgnify:CR=1 FL=1
MISCNRNRFEFDASGTFEADEVIVSSEVGGRIQAFSIEEGQTLPAGKAVGRIDAENLALQKDQVEESIKALKQKTTELAPQIKLLEDQLSVQETQLKNLLHEQNRTENLLKQDAATGKQLDDINYQIEVLRQQIQVTKQQMAVQRSNVSTQNRSVLSEREPLQKRVAQLNDQLNRATIVNPINGTVLTKYAESGEVTSVGKALYKIADLSFVNLRAYVTGSQLANIKLNQKVKVFVDKSEDDYRELSGVITWISDKAEFTPKTIQTKEERANLVYPIKIKVKNDGYLKIGMYGEVLLSEKE